MSSPLSSPQYPRHAEYHPARSSPLRHTSTSTTNSSAYSAYSNGVLPSRTGTVSSVTSSAYSQGSGGLGHQRGKSEGGSMAPVTARYTDRISAEKSPENPYGSVRRSLRPLPQAPNSSPSPPPTKRPLYSHSRSQTLDNFSPYQSEDPFVEKRHSSRDFAQATPDHHHVHHVSTNPHNSTILAPEDLTQLEKSSTGHLKILSKFAKSADSQDFSITAPVPSVVGLHGRRQLKRSDSTVGGRGKGSTRNYGFGERNWMDKQRQFLQAYEYLCHIGEAKEWIEDVIHKPIPPIVQLEEGLRDGVTLAEIVQALYPHRSLKVFRHAKLQFRHSDNIALFFRFLEDVELPDLFRFELVDLYEKKNIPKVIYCIHALSWLLYRKGILSFRIGNLVGQLQFEDHELEQTQRGLDKAGVSMPSFAGMGAAFGAEPEPEPVETEQEKQERELGECEARTIDLQAQIRGAMIRLRLGDTMQKLWDAEPALIDLQSRIRGDWARQVVEYRLNMQRFSVSLQSAARGFLARTRLRTKQESWTHSESDIVKLQSLFRARKARVEAQQLKSQTRRQDTGVRNLQAAIRGALARQRAYDQFEATRAAEGPISQLQGAARAFLARARVAEQSRRLGEATRPLEFLQAAAHGMSARAQTNELRALLKAESTSIAQLQALIRAMSIREDLAQKQAALISQESTITAFEGNVRGFLERCRLSRDHHALEEQTSTIIELQSLTRAAALRREVGDILTRLDGETEAITDLQALIRAMLCRSSVAVLLEELDATEPSIIEMQAAIRAKLVRGHFQEKQRFFRENMEKVVKIQSIARAKIQGQAYKSLTSGKNPPVGTLKGFVHLLNDSDFDFEEEIEFERLRKTVVQKVRQNELADQYVTQLDIKIALLVKNKITLDEVVKHQKHFGGHVGSLLSNAEISSKDPFDLKALNKTSRRKLEHYQELFFVLQTQPHYFSRLFRRLREVATPEKDCERIKHLMMVVFGYAQKRREEYYLVKLLVRSIREEVDGAQSIQDYWRTNAFWNKLFGAYIKSPRDRKYLRDVLGPLVKENIIENPQLDLESDPMQIYLSAINNEELRTGQRSRRNPNVPREEAIRDPETRATFIHHMQDLRDIADQFFAAVEDTLHKMPFGVRYVVQQTYEFLLAKFQEEDPGFILQMVGQWLWKNFMQPALTEPEKFGVVDRGLTQEQKRNLGEIAKVLGQIASGREFGGENVYLQPLNTYVRDSIFRLTDIWNHVMAVPSAEEYFDIDEFNDLYAKTKPTLYIKMADIFSIHHLLTTEIANICPSQDDVLRELLRELGSVKSNETELMGVSSTEITLTLNPKLHNAEDPDAEVKALFTETKRCVLYIIRVQSGKSLLEILVKPVTPEDEKAWQTLVRDELHTGGGPRGAYSEAHTMIDFGALGYAELKSIALENVLQLESVGRLTRRNQYQDLLNSIAVDIRTKHRRRIQRQRELDGVRTTLARLDEQAIYLEQQLKTYNDYIEQAMVTLQNKKGKKRFLMPFSKQWEHERELQRSGRSFKFGSYKYSARTLADKGVLVHWRGFLERQWSMVDLTISSNEIGVFTIDGSSGNMMIPGANAQIPLDDLLQAQFNNTQFMDFFEGALRVNVNLFLHLIMKKFYNE